MLGRFAAQATARHEAQRLEARLGPRRRPVLVLPRTAEGDAGAAPS
jgi:hypothetical protein